jgi:hypothetical protein
LSKGDQLTIEYNPKDPTKNRVSGDRGVLGHLFTIFLFGGTIAYFIIKTAMHKLSSLKAPGRQMTDNELHKNLS